MSESSVRLASLYEQLFTFGSLARVTILFAASYILYFTPTLLLLSSSGLSITSILALTLFIYPIILFLIDFLLIQGVFGRRDRLIFNPRRLMGKYLFIMLPSSAVLWMYHLLIGLSLQQGSASFTIPFFVVLFSKLFVDAVVYFPMLENGLAKQWATMFISVSTTYLLILSVGVEPPPTIIIGSALVSALPNVFYGYLEIRGRPILGESPFRYLRAYIDSWMLGDSSYMEELLERSSVDYKIPVHMLVFSETRPNPLALILPYLHFGPFKDIGSSAFPKIASEYLYLTRSLETGVFHTPSSHELDLPSKREVERMLGELMSLSGAGICNKLSNTVVEEFGDSRVYGLRLCSDLLLFIEYEEMEDIPTHISRELVSYAKERGFRDVLVVDCHNSLSNKKYIMDEKALEEVLVAGKKVIDRLRFEPLHRFKLGYFKIYPGGLSVRDGLGSNGVLAVYIETIEESTAIIIIDSNNMVKGLSKEISQSVRDLGVDNVVVATTDTHEVAALELVEGGYKLLGEDHRVRRPIIDSCVTAVEMARRNARPGNIEVMTREIGVKVLGYDLLEKLSRVSTYSARLFRPFFVAGYSATLFMSIILPHIVI